MHNPMDKTDVLRAQLEEALRRIEALESAKTEQKTKSIDIDEAESTSAVDQTKSIDEGPESTSSFVVPQRSPLFGRPRAAEIYNLYCHQTRHALGKLLKQKNAADVWDLMLSAFDAGLLFKNDFQIHYERALPLRTLFPWMPSKHRYSLRFDLRNDKDRADIKDVVLPVAIANRDAVMKNPDLLEDLVYRERQRRINEKIAQKAIENLAPGEQQIILFGKRYWPRPDDKNGAYDYDQLVTAVCWFRHLDSMSHRLTDAHSRAILIRHSVKWIADFVNRRASDADRRQLIQVFLLVRSVATALETAPDADCRFPTFPHID